MSPLQKAYEQRFEKTLRPLATAIEQRLQLDLAGQPRVDRVSARAKSVSRFIEKANTVENGQRKYSDPLNEIQDQVGARIVTFYRSDVQRITEIVHYYHRPVEATTHVPDTEWEFGYFGRHLVLLIPSDLIDRSVDESHRPQFFELQIKTLFQHAWSESNHDLGYKEKLGALTSDDKRLLAYTSAQAWGADKIFDDLFQKRSAQASPV